MTAREAAYQALAGFRQNGAWPDLYLKNAAADMPREDAALASEITYGTLQNLALIDFYISSFSAIRLKKLMPQVLDILRTAVYQIVFLQRVPDSAAVNEAVKLVKKKANPRAAAYANAVLRRIAEQKSALPEPERKDLADYFSVKYSHPLWFVRKMIGALGANGCEKLLAANNAHATAAARVNTLKSDRDTLLRELEEENISVSAHPFVDDAVVFDSLRGVISSCAFKEGKLYIQDIAGQLAVHALAPQPGSRALDACAAPGGKSLMMAQLMRCKGGLLSCDIYDSKVEELMKNAEKYGVYIMDAAKKDAAEHDPGLDGAFDFIMCDVPCSGLGIIRKKPDIRFKSEADIAALPQLQYNILANVSRYLKSGGHIVYSTCTVLKEENEDIIERFLAASPDFEAEAFTLPGIGDVSGMITLYPHLHGTDGFFIAKLHRKQR